jgi:hypothetical protein
MFITFASSVQCFKQVDSRLLFNVSLQNAVAEFFVKKLDVTYERRVVVVENFLNKEFPLFLKLSHTHKKKPLASSRLFALSSPFPRVSTLLPLE